MLTLLIRLLIRLVCQGATEWDDCSDLSPSQRDTMEEWKAKFLSKYYVRYDELQTQQHAIWACVATFWCLVLDSVLPSVTTPIYIPLSPSGRLVKDKDAEDKPPLPEWNIA